MRLIVGLGNIGHTFAGTRHNIGFMSLDALANQNSMVWQSKDKFKATVAEATIAGQKVVLAKPNTLYNLSGDAVRALKDFYKLANEDILVVHDELALPFGTLRTRTGGSDAGNNGIKSILATTGADVSRIRIGTANEHTQSQDTADFVLAQFTPAERQKLPDIQNEIQRLLHAFIEQGRLPHSSVAVHLP